MTQDLSVQEKSEGRSYPPSSCAPRITAQLYLCLEHAIMIMESGTTLQAHACSAAQTFKIFQSVESRQRRPTNEQTKKETDRRTRALRWVTSQKVTLKHSVPSKESIHMTHRWCRKGHARSGSLRDSFRQRGHASHRCALRVGSRESSPPALERRVSLFCVTSKSWFQWNGGYRSKIILFKPVRLIDLAGWRRTPKTVAMRCSVVWKRSCAIWPWHHLGLASLAEGCAVPALTQRDGVVVECVPGIAEKIHR